MEQVVNYVDSGLGVCSVGLDPADRFGGFQAPVRQCCPAEFKPLDLQRSILDFGAWASEPVRGQDTQALDL